MPGQYGTPWIDSLDLSKVRQVGLLKHKDNGYCHSGQLIAFIISKIWWPNRRSAQTCPFAIMDISGGVF